MNPSILLRGGPSGPTFEPSTAGYVLTVNADGKTISPQPGGSGTIDASQVVNDSPTAPGASVADALEDMVTTPSFSIEDNAGNVTGAQGVSVASHLARFFTLTGNATVTITGLIAGRSQWGQFRVIQGGIGSFTLALVGAKTPGGAGLTLSTAVGAQDIVSFFWNGTNIYAQVVGLAFA